MADDDDTTREHRGTRDGERADDGPTDLPRDSWYAALKRTPKEFSNDHLSDWAAALTYYALLSLFPGMLVLIALLGLIGEHPQTTNALLDLIGQVAPKSAADLLSGTIAGVVQNKGGAGALFGIGLLGAIWSASGYIGAFFRASNAVWDIEEGR